MIGKTNTNIACQEGHQERDSINTGNEPWIILSVVHLRYDHAKLDFHQYRALGT